MPITLVINGENYTSNSFTIRFLSIIYEKEYKLPTFTSYTPDKKFYDAYAGVYSSDELPIHITVFVEDGVLKAQGQGQPAFTLNPIGKHTFDFKQAGLEMEFDPYTDKMTLKQAGQVFEMKKD